MIPIVSMILKWEKELEIQLQKHKLQDIDLELVNRVESDKTEAWDIQSARQKRSKTKMSSLGQASNVIGVKPAEPGTQLSRRNKGVCRCPELS